MVGRGIELGTCDWVGRTGTLVSTSTGTGDLLGIRIVATAESVYLYQSDTLTPFIKKKKILKK